MQSVVYRQFEHHQFGDVDAIFHSLVPHEYALRSFDREGCQK